MSKSTNAGRELNKIRNESLSADERSAIAKTASAARNAKLGPDERSEIARKAVTARWSKRKGKP